MGNIFLTMTCKSIFSDLLQVKPTPFSAAADTKLKNLWAVYKYLYLQINIF